MFQMKCHHFIGAQIKCMRSEVPLRKNLDTFSMVDPEITRSRSGCRGPWGLGLGGEFDESMGCTLPENERLDLEVPPKLVVWKR